MIHPRATTTQTTPHDDPPRMPRALKIEIGFRTMLLALGAVALAWIGIQIIPIVLVVVVALMLVGALAPPIAMLERLGVPRGWSIALVFVGILLAFAGIVIVTAPQVGAQVRTLIETLPTTQANIASKLEKARWSLPLAKYLRSRAPTQLTTEMAPRLLAYSTAILEVIAYGVTSIFLALYIIIDRSRMRGALFGLLPRRFHVRLGRVMVHLEKIVGGYVRGQLLTSLFAGLFTFVVLLVAGVPNALAIATFAGVADILPYVGAFLACAPAVLAAMPQGWSVALPVLIALSLYQELESRFIVPRVYGRVLRLPPAVIIVALLIGAKLLGILGAILALPVAAALRMIAFEFGLELPGDEHDFAHEESVGQVEDTFAELAKGATANEAAAMAVSMAEAHVAEDPPPPDSTDEREPPP